MLEDVAFVLPSDMLAAMYRKGDSVMNQCLLGAGGADDIARYWLEEDQSFVRGTGLSEEQLRFTIPMGFHEDGVPKWHDESAVFWSWMTPLTTAASLVSRSCIVGVSSSKVCRATRQSVLDILVWDLKSLRQGLWPASDHTGMPFPPNSLRGRRAGQPIAGPWRAVFAFWKGDQEAVVEAHRVRNHYRCNFICDWCYASKKIAYLAYGDFQDNANWVDTSCVDAPDPSDWCAVEGYSRTRRLWDGDLGLQECIPYGVCKSKNSGQQAFLVGWGIALGCVVVESSGVSTIGIHHDCVLGGAS